MLDTDSLLMKRAIELARGGAGLASPNPLVGALLINDGRVVGEGYHIYENVRHAEPYAIEAAGPLAKGATLYCNLEPCCHQGRTPPCTDALINAKIARAVVAVKDPNPNVNGQGIERLREAGIEVDLGVLEARALRLNESYLKYITRGVPFLHAVIEYPAGGTARAHQWRPSKEFLQTVAECDAVMTGDNHELNMLVVEEARGRTRHRPVVIVVSNPGPQFLKFLKRQEVSVLHLESEGGGDARKTDADRKVVNLDEGPAHGVLRSRIEVAKAMLARMNVTSLVILPGALDLSDSANFEELDKATLVVPGWATEQQHALHWTLGDIEFDFEQVSVTEVEGFAEVIGYPSAREAA